MTILRAVTKKRRNLMRIDTAFATDMKAAIARRDEQQTLKVRQQRRRLIDAVMAAFRRDCEAAK